ncbi:MAG: FecR domain-containing protein [Polyangiaceae bacterium]|nr:FecR domain-containing protein [Polyangiaceae bacterium]
MTTESPCEQVLDHLSELLEGTAPEELVDHVAECDGCRDLRHDAERAIERLREAGADYVPPADLDARLVAALAAREPSPAAAPSDDARDAPPRATESEAAGDGAPVATQRLPVTDAKVSGDGAPSATPRPADAPPAPQPAETTEATATHVGPPGQGAVGAPPPAANDAAPSPVAPAAPPRRLGSSQRRVLFAATAAAAVAAGLALVLRGGVGGSRGPIAAGPGWSGNVAGVSGESGGLQACAPSGDDCVALVAGGAVAPGTMLRTDARTRARVELADGTSLALERSTKLGVVPGAGRALRLEAGAIVAEVARVSGSEARIELPHGRVTVLGTKLAVRTEDGASQVEVSRGVVELADPEGRSVRVRAGEEGRLRRGIPPYVSPSASLGDALAWAETANGRGDDDVPARGLGELRAKKPGEDQERKGAVTLTTHAVKVRIAGAVARTEIDETFTNGTDEVLEGIYRFPLPPDAKIERLALEVDGKLEEGAFVDRERAAAIWRGAIVTAAPQLRPRVQEEIVWVPGPWKDPALLEWQRGGRFELRIYPIPKRGSRRVVLAYTQVVHPTAGVRRYTYPMAHDPSGSTRVGTFEVDVQVRGHDESYGVTSLGYELSKGDATDAAALRLVARDFAPTGDLALEYALPGRERELTAWAYQGEPPRAAIGAAGAAGAASGLPADAPYVALAVRPKLPRATDGEERRDVAIVVDTSRSMYGESHRRAVALAARFAAELDHADRVLALACDTACRALPGGPIPAGAQAAHDVRAFLEGVAPDGATDPVEAVRSALQALGREGGRARRVVYVGDGAPTAGALRPAWIARAVERAIAGADVSVTAVAVGADSDATTLAALARGGGGVALPFVPGQTVAEAAFALLGAVYGAALSDPVVELPAGLEEIAPTRLDAIPAGGESIVVARMRGAEARGTVVLRGRVAGRAFEQRYPVEIVATRSPGNAFVPRLHAAYRIADLEQDPAPEAKREAIRLSGAYDVASRYTSLLVLESPAMFRAFGLDNTRDAPDWTGEAAAESTTAAREDGEDPAASGAGDSAGGFAGADKKKDAEWEDSAGVGRLGAGSGIAMPGGAAPPAKAGAATPSNPYSVPPAATAAPPPRPAESKPSMLADDWPAQERARRVRPRPRPMIPMRRVWERKGEISTERLTPASAGSSALATAEGAVRANESSRTAVQRLFTLSLLAGDLERATPLARRWSEKEPLDPEALTARADVAASGGDRALAIRILGSVVDVRPGNVKAQQRLARLWRWAGRPELGCRHALALAQLVTKDGKILADAVRCGRETGESELASDLLAAAEPEVRRAAEAELARTPQSDELSGDLRVEATWSEEADLDLAILTPEGHRVSFLGAPTRQVITARDATSTRGEGLALRAAPAGEYVIEIVRARGEGPVSGTVTLTAAGARRTLPFRLTGSRLTLGIAKIRLESRLVPLGGPQW